MDGVRLTGLWKEKTKDGRTYLSGKLGAARILVFPNDRKVNEKDPDYSLLLAPAKKKDAPAPEADDPL